MKTINANQRIRLEVNILQMCVWVLCVRERERERERERGTSDRGE